VLITFQVIFVNISLSDFCVSFRAHFKWANDGCYRFNFRYNISSYTMCSYFKAYIV